MAKNSNEQYLAALRESMRSTSRRTIWTVRIVLLALFAAWAVIGVYLFSQLRQSSRELEEARLEQTRREERVRRAAVYRQALEESDSPRTTTQNAVDAYK